MFFYLFFTYVVVNLCVTFQVKDAANAAYDAAAPKVNEGAEYLKDKAGEAYEAVKPKVTEGAEYLKDKAGEAYETGSKNFSIVLFFKTKFCSLR